MNSIFHLLNKKFQIDLNHPIDLSMPLSNNPESTRAWYVDPVSIEPVRENGFLGSVKEGGNVNFRTIKFNPHGNGTHTECVGHIAEEVYSLNQHLKKFWFHAIVITVTPEKVIEEKHDHKIGDFIITLDQIKSALNNRDCEALIIRTLPNTEKKLHTNYSNTNPCYLDVAAAQFISEQKIDHLLIDLPSIDREEDGGELAAHHAFWNHPENTQFHRTISELIYVPNEVKDGEYLLNLMITSLENDASPSKPVLYPII